MKHYETVIVFPPTLSESDLDNLINGIEEDLKSRHGASDVKINRWGKRNLAYPIKKFTEGYYILCDYYSDKSNTVSDFESRLRINEAILRFLTIRRDLEEKAEKRLLRKLSKISRKEEEGEDYEEYKEEENDMD